MRDISRKKVLIWPKLRRHPDTSYCASGGISKVRHFLLYFRHFVLESCNFVIVWVIRWEFLRSLGSPPIYHHRKRFCIQCSSKICRTCKLLAFGGALLTERKELKDDAHVFNDSCVLLEPRTLFALFSALNCPRYWMLSVENKNPTCEAVFTIVTKYSLRQTRS